MAVAGDNGAARVTRLMYFGQDVETPVLGVRPWYQETLSFDGELMIFMTMTLGLRIGYLLIKSISS